MKRLTTLFLAVLMLLTCAACGSSGAGKAETEKETAGSSGLNIVATVFPEYDWTREVLGDNPAGADLTLLLDSGVDLHSYQPTAEDMLKISSCDVFIYLGGVSDTWVADALAGAANKDMQVVNLMEVLGSRVQEEEIVQGMEAEEEEEASDGPEYDEHVWLSLTNAGMIVSAISEALGQADPDHADLYAANAKAYQDQLTDLDGQYQAAVSESSFDTLLFADRFPFRYMTDDYGLNYYAAFAGCSAETEASFDTIIFLAGKADELGLKTILTIDGSDHSIAETVASSTASKDLTIAEMDSMQSVSEEEIASGVTYLSIMEKNLETLRQALN